MEDKKKQNQDEEIIKDLTELSRYTGFQEKYIQVLNATLDLINRQKLEIERLKGSTIVNNIMESQRIKRETKAEAYKEFAEHLKEEWFNHYYSSPDLDFYEFVDKFLKEMLDG